MLPDICFFDGLILQQLNFKHLRYFWMVAKTGSIARAATQLHLTPHAISGQLREFSHSLGVELFRRSGRHLELTDAGQRILSYAQDIFAIGEELIEAVHDHTLKRPVPFRIGIVDSVSKNMASQLLQPALAMQNAPRLICREGRLTTLLGDLAVHRLDMILADRTMPAHFNVRAYHHLLLETSLTVFGAPALAQQYKKKFPSSLNHAPFLLPSEDTAIAAPLQHWFEAQRIKPQVVGEFDDSALMKAFGQAGSGLFAAPTVLEKLICAHYQVAVVGRVEGVTAKIYAITTERRLTHPVVVAISEAVAVVA